MQTMIPLPSLLVTHRVMERGGRRLMGVSDEEREMTEQLFASYAVLSVAELHDRAHYEQLPTLLAKRIGARVWNASPEETANAAELVQQFAATLARLSSEGFAGLSEMLTAFLDVKSSPVPRRTLSRPPSQPGFSQTTDTGTPAAPATPSGAGQEDDEREAEIFSLMVSRIGVNRVSGAARRPNDICSRSLNSSASPSSSRFCLTAGRHGT
jgi:hypothetical protein